jgi:hypothetical protein
MDKNESSVFGCLGVWVALVFVLVFGPILNGWVLSILWDWFIVYQFGLPSISIPVAIGISLTASMLTSRPKLDNTKSTGKSNSNLENFAELFGIGFGTPLLILFLGYIVKLFL